jgi:hypothetical protein
VGAAHVLSGGNEKRLQRLLQGLLDMKSREFSLAAGPSKVRAPMMSASVFASHKRASRHWTSAWRSLALINRHALAQHDIG